MLPHRFHFEKQEGKVIEMDWSVQESRLQTLGAHHPNHVLCVWLVICHKRKQNLHEDEQIYSIVLFSSKMESLHIYPSVQWTGIA